MSRRQPIAKDNHIGTGYGLDKNRLQARDYRDRTKPQGLGTRPRSRSVSPARKSEPPPYRRERPQNNKASNSFSRETGFKEADLERKWRNDEDNFILKQMKDGSIIRIKDNRAKPIDWFVVCLKYLEPNESSHSDLVDSLLGLNSRQPVENPYDLENLDIKYSDVHEFEFPEPTSVISSLSENELEQLKVQCEEFAKLDENKRNFEFWQSTIVLCTERLWEMGQKVKSRDSRVVEVVSSDIDNLIIGKSATELADLEKRVDTMLQSANISIDRDFWLQISKRLKVDKARAQLLSAYIDSINIRTVLVDKVRERELSRNSAESRELVAKLDALKDHLIKARKDPVQYPELLKRIASVTSDNQISMSKSTHQSAHSPIYPTALDESEFDIPKANEAHFNDEVESNANPELVKPKYYNRVILGYEWNKYNKAHYTSEHPPPKVVQGYKFNIFYPKLTGSATIPSYKIIPDKTKSTSDGASHAGSDTVILLFQSPAPYQNIAFRIVDQPWDRSSHGNSLYKSQFENGVLQLHFKFKKTYYKT
ncbi:hypothetical protein AWJ20_106 [Sugiyamaella lignohabitans]|uniref:Splicing factor Cactin n=1 Tax=Sugiyamaella lignohabitans TaxID=796027 RepID=A0A161HGG5_9ASCO|nr:uncharacterized protein AWJ20_106 [Sugiyamaella lignohabitans]ANB11881.1 hypothetical protein AWJ20_106 [Sugiyamaella lignohabitans]